MWNALTSKLGPLVMFPGFYWLFSRQTPRTISGWLVKVLGYAILFVVLVTNATPAHAALVVLGAWLSFLCVYEVGYLQNDLRVDREPTARHYRKGPKFVRQPFFVLARGIFLALVFWKYQWWSNLWWIALLVVTILVFFAHNRLRSDRRLATFASLRVLSSLSMVMPTIGEMPDHMVGALAVYLLPVLLSDLLPRILRYGMEKKALFSPIWSKAAVLSAAFGPPVLMLGGWLFGQPSLVVTAAYQWTAWLSILGLSHWPNFRRPEKTSERVSRAVIVSDA